jgi:hypothetical protein
MEARIAGGPTDTFADGTSGPHSGRTKRGPVACKRCRRGKSKVSLQVTGYRLRAERALVVFASGGSAVQCVIPNSCALRDLSSIHRELYRGWTFPRVCLSRQRCARHPYLPPTLPHNDGNRAGTSHVDRAVSSLILRILSTPSYTPPSLLDVCGRRRRPRPKTRLLAIVWFASSLLAINTSAANPRHPSVSGLYQEDATRQVY